MRRTVGFLVACALALLAPQTASAVVVDFSSIVASPGGNLGVSSYTGVGWAVTAEAFYYDATGGSYVATNLFARNEGANELGFGVCSPSEQGNNACKPVGQFTGGGGDINELDNLGAKEMIRLTLADGWDWTKAAVSSLDSLEAGELWYGNSASLTASSATALGDFSATKFLAFKSNGTSTVKFEYAITGASAAAKYLYFIPGGSLATTGDNDYLVWKVEVETCQGPSCFPTVPEPSTLALLALGLAGLGLTRRRG